MSRWFRFYDDALNDPKVQRLPGDLFKAWVNILCIASKNDGTLPQLEDLAFALRMEVSDLSGILNELCTRGLIDPVEVDGAPMSYEPHNWGERQFIMDQTDPTAPTRMRAYRKRQKERNAERNAERNGDRNAAVTHTVTDIVTPERNVTTRTDTDTEQKKDAAPAAPVVSPEIDYFRRMKEICGPSGGGLGKKLLDAKQGNIPLARAAAEQASTKADPREYIGAIIRGRGGGVEDLRARGEAW